MDRRPASPATAARRRPSGRTTGRSLPGRSAGPCRARAGAKCIAARNVRWTGGTETAPGRSPRCDSASPPPARDGGGTARASAADRWPPRAGGSPGRPGSWPRGPRLAGPGASPASTASREQIGRRLPEIELVQAPVPAAPRHQLGVRAAVDDATFHQQQHEICVRDRGQVVRYHETGLTGHQAIECLAHGRLAFHVETGHRLVQNQDRGVANERARDGDALPLPAGEGRAPLADDAVVPVFQLTDELVGVGGLGRRDDLVRARFGAAVRNIFPDGRAEQQRLLEHEPDLAPQRLAAIMADVDPVDEDRPFLGLVQTQDQADDGGLAGARCPDQGQPLPRRYLEGDLPQHVLAAVMISDDRVAAASSRATPMLSRTVSAVTASNRSSSYFSRANACTKGIAESTSLIRDATFPSCLRCVLTDAFVLR